MIERCDPTPIPEAISRIIRCRPQDLAAAMKAASVEELCEALIYCPKDAPRGLKIQAEINRRKSA